MDPSKLTVLIPTRERCDTLRATLRSVASINDGGLEILVSDNCSSDGTRDVVLEAGDPRIRYVNTGTRLSMSKNWEFALSHVNDGWITFIGDDDALLPLTLSRLREVVSETNVSVVRSSVCRYQWPEVLGKPYGRVQIPLRSGHDVRDSREWLRRTLKGETYYEELPMLYNGGFADVSVVRRLRDREGRFFHSAIPDIYSAVAIARTVERYAYSHEPLAISGASRHSTGTSLLGGGRPNTGAGRRFEAEGNIPWHKSLVAADSDDLPMSLELLVFESYFQSEHLGGSLPGISPRLVLEVVLAHAWLDNPRLRVWADSYANRHGIPTEDIENAARFHRATLRGRTAFAGLLSRLHTYALGSPSLPVRDSLEASVAVSEVLRKKPGLLENAARLTGRAVKKLLGT